MIKDIQDNTEDGVWADGSFDAMSEDVLIKIHKSIKKESPIDYSIQNLGEDNLQVDKGEVEPMILGRDIKEEKEKEDK